MIFVLLITGTLAGLFVSFARLTGSGDENALFLLQMLNTQINLRGLLLAYAGAALPMLLMFSLGRGNYGFLVNFEFIAEEIVRTLVGSLGFVSAVPLTTAIAILFALRADSRGKWSRGLGPVGSGDGHSHVHSGATFRLVLRIESTRSASE